MNARLGTILYRAGLIGAAISVFYTVNIIWAHQTGSALVSLTRRYVSREDMLSGITAGIVAALLCWSAGAAARALIRRWVEKHDTAE